MERLQPAEGRAEIVLHQDLNGDGIMGVPPPDGGPIGVPPADGGPVGVPPATADSFVFRSDLGTKRVAAPANAGTAEPPSSPLPDSSSSVTAALVEAASHHMSDPHDLQGGGAHDHDHMAAFHHVALHGGGVFIH